MQIYLLLTENCNLNCSMCIRGLQEGTNIEFDTLKNLDFINKIHNDDIVITGGEPTLHKQFCEIVDFMCKHTKTVTVTSNGTTDYYFDKIKNYDNLFFQISVDGSVDHHNNIRGKGSFEKTINTIEKLDMLGFKYSVASVVNKYNLESMFELSNILSELNNIRFWKLSYEMPFGSADFNNMMTSFEWNNFADSIINHAKLRLKIQKIFPLELYESKKEYLEKIISNSNRSFNCGSGKDKLYIYPNFNVYSCTCLTDFCLGNLKETPFENIINGDEINKFVNYEVSKDTICFTCEYKKFCNGGCIGMSYHYYGSLGKGDIRCPKLNVMK
ncbi:MAG: radical SAM protein [Paraclostridium sp.]